MRSTAVAITLGVVAVLATGVLDVDIDVDSITADEYGSARQSTLDITGIVPDTVEPPTATTVVVDRLEPVTATPTDAGPAAESTFDPTSDTPVSNASTPSAAPAPSPAATSPTTTPTSTVTPRGGSSSLDYARLCGDEIVAFAASLLHPHQISVPAIQVGATERAYYEPGSRSIVYASCESASVVAHELGHYVHHLAMGSFGAMLEDSEASFCPGGDDGTGRCADGWIRGNEYSPGIEHAGHCIGSVLWRNDTYTKCPDPALAATARERVAAA